MSDDKPVDGTPESGSDSFFDKPGPGAPGPEEVPMTGVQPGSGVDGGIRKPADYYSQDEGGAEPMAPGGEASQPVAPLPAGEKKGCPTWLLGCGIAVVIGVLIVIGFIYWGFSSGKAFSMVFSSVAPLIEESNEIDADMKQSLKDEIAELNRHIEQKELGAADLQGPMTALQTAVSDQHIDADEAQDLLEMLQTLNDRASREEF